MCTCSCVMMHVQMFLHLCGGQRLTLVTFWDAVFLSSCSSPTWPDRLVRELQRANCLYPVTGITTLVAVSSLYLTAEDPNADPLLDSVTLLPSPLPSCADFVCTPQARLLFYIANGRQIPCLVGARGQHKIGDSLVFRLELSWERKTEVCFW